MALDIEGRNTFQFLYGSIKSPGGGFGIVGRGSFQFLYGSIKSRHIDDKKMPVFKALRK
jgi:hypothetical protein